MSASPRRIPTTHVGSLVRPDELVEFLLKQQNGQRCDEPAFEDCLRRSVAEVVRKQKEAGIDVVSDGEYGKTMSWSRYILDRLSGLEERQDNSAGFRPAIAGKDRRDFAEFYDEYETAQGFAGLGKQAGRLGTWVVTGPIRYTGQAAIRRDIANLNAAIKGLGVEVDDAFLTSSYDIMVPPKTLADYRKWAAVRVEALNHALKGIPEEKSRYHLCWGSWNGPHTNDVALKDIVDLVLKVRVGGYSLEMANPRHEHEWRVWEAVKLPAGRKLVPGLISHATNVVEHPELVAERIVRLANLVGRENVIASTDCGFAHGPFARRVHPSIMWAKLRALADGARLAGKALWRPARKSVKIARKRRKS